MIKNRHIEILSPAGSYESLITAINAGADAIYFGVEQLNMRARSSDNFTLDDLEKIANICKKNNTRSYITLNTVIYDHDLQLMRNIVNAAKKSGISAIIASDIAVMEYVRSVGMELHISTQANVSNIEAVAFYSTYADVMVLARELSLKQVAQITSEIKRKNITGPGRKLIRIELFAHGALCMAISGKCYLSLHSHFASANRGACIQNCRRKYIVKDEEDDIELAIDNEYIMSSKDLCTIEFLDKIINSGVSILKIEGRGRSSDYVHITTLCYRQAVDAIKNGTYNKKQCKMWKEKLSTVFNRGFWDGYYLGKKLGEWNNTYGSQATKRKIYLGKGIKYFSKIKVGEFLIESDKVRTGDEILITGPDSGLMQIKIKELRINDKINGEAKKGDVFSMPVDRKIRPSDRIYKLVDVS